MPGLNTREMTQWDENVYEQYKVAQRNCTEFLTDFHKNFWQLPHNLFYHFSQRLADFSPIWKDSKPEDVPWMLKLQRDISAFILLFDNGFDFTRYEWIGDDLYQVAEVYIRSIWKSPTDIATVFPPMAQDAEKALKTDWKEPPVADMVRASDYFASRTQQAINNTGL